MPPQHTRRAFIQAVGGVSVTGLAGSATATSGTTDEAPTVSAADLVIPETAVPTGFERHPTADSDQGAGSFAETLQHLDPRFESVETATNAYWKGGVESDPRWVLSSIALIGEDRFPRLHIEYATDAFYEDYIDEYDTETSVLIDVGQSYAVSGNTADWQFDILEVPLLTDAETEPSPILVERMHQQYLDNLFLATVVFGPADGSPSVESLLEQFATVQRDRYDLAKITQ
jgi:hypothetical protein